MNFNGGLLALLLVGSFATQTWSQEPPEPVDEKGQVTLQIVLPQKSWPAGSIPKFELIVKNDTDVAADIVPLRNGILQLNAKRYRTEFIPALDLSYKHHRIPPRSEGSLGTLEINDQWHDLKTGIASDKPVLTPGEYKMQFRLRGARILSLISNEVRFTIEPYPK